MSEEKDVAQVEAEMAALEARGGDSHNGVGPKGASGGDAVPPQLDAHRGPARAQGRAPPAGAGRPHAARVRRGDRSEAIRAVAARGPARPGRLRRVRSRPAGAGGRHWAPEPDAAGPAAARTATLPRQGGEG